ncbi:unnamed protein product [Paramecium pentaurelia]|uniref:Uncharacterized protein n=1 Tax=Paramecium pentaurelia TaxID=43138 RepID=A0A8S1VEN3_9CILI|nr:unnamed protein product [Paramecium pentaurelia]
MEQHLLTTSCSEDEEENKTLKQVQLVVFPKRFLNPLSTFRMNGDFHLYSDAKNIVFNNNLKLGVSSQNPYKKVSKVLIDKGRLIIQYTQLDFSITPWEYVVKKLDSYGDADIHKLSQYIQKYIESLKDGLQQAQGTFENHVPDYRASGLYQYKYIKDLDQLFISQVQYDINLIEELGYNVSTFIDSCLKYGIPEISLKYGSTNQEYYKNIMEFAKPLAHPHQSQEYYLYSHLYPEGIKTEVSFQVEHQSNSTDEDQLINFNIYYNYQPQQNRFQFNNNDKKTRQRNCISHYYQLQENQFQRCGYKKVKL